MIEETAIKLISEKMKLAAQLLGECRDIADRNGLSVDIPYIDYDESKFEDDNWKSSSYRC